MMHVRDAAVAGMFYPANPRELAAEVNGLLDRNRTPGAAPKAVIAPHAGYMYSGPVAASVYSRLCGARIERVVLVGPSHRVAFRGVAVPEADAFETPLGRVELDAEGLSTVLALPAVSRRADAHLAEHSLEVHLPFLQVALGAFRLIPLVVGMASTDDVAAAVDAVWGGPETLIVVSSDLSHYHPYDHATAIDAETCSAIRELRGGLGPDQACGCVGINALLALARRRGLAIEEVDRRNSGDTAGSRDQVVGYVSYALYEH